MDIFKVKNMFTEDEFIMIFNTLLDKKIDIENSLNKYRKLYEYTKNKNYEKIIENKQKELKMIKKLMKND